MLSDVVKDLGRATRLQAALALSDAQLLERFAAQRDAAAFEALMHRHGPLVFGVCRKLLYDPHDVEDAFQATFLVLARKAATVRWRSLLGNWLYGVAYRVAARARKTALRRRIREQTGIDPATWPDREQAPAADWSLLVHEEVQRLPDKYRAAVVLCYLEGKTNEEAARQLNCPVSTVKGRLALARDRLRTRLNRRGVEPSATLPGSIVASIPAGLLTETTQTVLTFAAGGTVPASIATLTHEVCRTMLLNKLKLVTVLVLAVAVLGGVGGLLYPSGVAVPPVVPGEASKPPAQPKEADKPKDDKAVLQGVWHVRQFIADGKDVTDIDVGAAGFTTPRGSKWIFTDDGVVLRTALGGKYTFALDPGKAPKTIDLTDLWHEKESSYLGLRKATDYDLRGIYSLEGDVLTICLTRGGERPTALASKEGSHTELYVLEHEPREDQGKLPGTWRVTGIHAAGKEVTNEAGEPRLFAQARWVVTADKLALVIPASGETVLEFTYKLDPLQKPKAIDLTLTVGPADQKGKTRAGVYSLDGDWLELCLPFETTAKRPAEIAAKEGDKTLLINLRRQRTKDK